MKEADDSMDCTETNEPAGFETVLQDELELLAGLRRGDSHTEGGSVYERARHSDLAGVAFSGGGIRSATFNLGVIQALARYGLLSRFDYLSTVSGGGYIGGWLSALLHREAIKNNQVDESAVEAFSPCLKSHPPQGCMHGTQQTVGFAPVEHLAVRYLRRYSNYLSPKLGLSGDMLAVASIFLRNFILIQFTLISLLTTVLLLAHAVGISAHLVTGHTGVAFLASVLLFFFSVSSAARLASERHASEEKPAHASLWVNVCVIVPSTFAAWLLSAAAASENAWFYQSPRSDVADALLWMLCGSVLYGAAWLLGYLVACKKKGAAPSRGQEGATRPITPPPLMIGSALFAGALLGLLLFATAYYLKTMGTPPPIDLWHAVAFGPPLVLLGLSLVVTVHIGGARNAFCAGEREWLARLGGLALLYAAGWTLLFALVLYAAPFVHWLAGGGIAALAVWASGSGAGAWLARSATNTAAGAPSLWKTIITRAAPWLFVAGLAVLLADLTHIALLGLASSTGYIAPHYPDFGSAAASALAQLNGLSCWPTLFTFGGVGALFLLAVHQLDINLFSLHTMYSNRLARTFLGASNAGHRQPNPFSGFDEDDDLPFSDLRRQRPIPIINTAINMTGGDDLAWQTRRAASFAFTPCWAGYETRSSQGVKLGAYRPTNKYAGRLNLGTLIAVSGAAASPNMGYYTSPAVAALLTAFNLRLGRWCGNPDLPPGRGKTALWQKASPRCAASPIFAELTGSANAQASWVNLTDGGHFENLGVYELIRRRCRFILVTDVGADPHYHFEDLANLLRKCWTDLGVNIYFDNFEQLRPAQQSRYSEAHAAVGHINYNDDGPQGTLIYLKSSMTGTEWPDIRQYADTHEEFPHQSTLDQFFDENQFEAYRHLGFKAMAETITVLLQPFLGGESYNQHLKEYVTINDIATTLASARHTPPGH